MANQARPKPKKGGRTTSGGGSEPLDCQGAAVLDGPGASGGVAVGMMLSDDWDLGVDEMFPTLRSRGMRVPSWFGWPVLSEIS